MNTKQWIMDSKIGPLFLVATPTALVGVHWKKQKSPLTESLKGSDPAIKILSQAHKELEEYFAGKRKVFSVPLEVKGTPFQQKVWEALRKIPFGKTYSYSEIASQIKKEKAVRAVGSANGKNPISIIIPCHRVIRSEGTLGGYAGGLDTKTTLLAHEKINLI